MGYPAQIVFSRHAETVANALKTLEERVSLGIGTQHLQLTDLGRRQKAAMGAWLRREFQKPFDAYYVSSYPRAKDTLMGYWSDVEPVECALVDEVNFGFRHYTRPDDIPTNFPHEHARMSLDGFYHHRPLGGESWPDVELRVRMFLTELSRLHAGERVFVCGHAAWYTAFRRVAEGLTVEQMFNKETHPFISNCGIRIYEGVPTRGKSPWNRTKLVLKGGCDLSEDLTPIPFTI